MRSRHELILVAVIVTMAFVLRVYPPWSAVFEGETINFLETDSWYHVRLIENQVHNWPWRVTVDPYAAPGGQFVPVAPLFDTIISTAVVLLHGRHADTQSIERIAAFAPPVLGVGAVIVIWALGRRLYGVAAGLLAAGLLSILPGHFLDRTLLGFVDHHALEALLALAVFWAVAVALEQPHVARDCLAGFVLGLYLLAWASGAFLVAVLIVWLLVTIVIAREHDDVVALSRVMGTAALVAMLMIVVFQDARMHRYGSQLLSLLFVASVALAITALRARIHLLRSRVALAAAPAVVGVAAVVMGFWWAPNVTRQLLLDVARLTPDATRMSVLEARPLFWYPGEWTWSQPWTFFRTGFFVGLAGIVALSIRVARGRRPMDIGLVLFALVSLLATVGQNRFGYYLVPALAILGGYVASRILDWGFADAPDGMPARLRAVPIRREIAAVVVAAAIFAPNLKPSAAAASRTGTLPPYWRDAMTWLRLRSTPPFTHSAGAGDEYYVARYPEQPVRPDYSVLNWWDHGYWILQLARRVPVANPTQGGAHSAAQFYVATDEAAAGAVLDLAGSRYVLTDWELPFRLTADGNVMGRFQSVADWAGVEHARYYEVYYRRDGNAWSPVWVFHRPYYDSMVYRLMVMGGRAALPSGTTVMTITERSDARGLRFQEVVSERTYETFEAAASAATSAAAAAAGQRALIVGLDPWRPAFPIEPVRDLVQVYAARTAGQEANESPWVRVFERRR